VLAESYPFAAAIDYFGRADGLPQAHSGYRGYGYFAPPPETDDTAVYVGADPGELRRFFTRVTPLRLEHPGFDTKIWLCEGRNTAWTRIWPQIMRMQ
jgi:hypothetical protein